MRTSLRGSTSTAPLVGVALAIVMVGLAVAAMPVTSTPLEVPRALGCTWAPPEAPTDLSTCTSAPT